MAIGKTTASVVPVKTAQPSVELLSLTPNGEDIIERACRTCYLSFNRYDPPKSTRNSSRRSSGTGTSRCWSTPLPPSG